MVITLRIETRGISYLVKCALSVSSVPTEYKKCKYASVGCASKQDPSLLAAICLLSLVIATPHVKSNLNFELGAAVNQAKLSPLEQIHRCSGRLLAQL